MGATTWRLLRCRSLLPGVCAPFPLVLLFLLVAEPYLVQMFEASVVHLAFVATATAGGIHVIRIQLNVFMTLALAVAVVLVGALTAPVAIMVAAFAVARIVASACSAQRIRRKNSGKNKNMVDKQRITPPFFVEIYPFRAKKRNFWACCRAF